MTRNSFAASVRTVWDILLPGDGSWPTASVALGDVDRTLAGFSVEAQAWLLEHATQVFEAPPGERIDLMRSLERAFPACFASLLSQLYEAYYNSAETQKQVIRLAETAPHELSPYFDPALVETVLSIGLGRRRL